MSDVRDRETGGRWRLITRKLWAWLVLPVLVYGLATVILTYPLPFHLTNGVPDTADPLLNSWILAWDAYALRTHPLDLYHANSFYPYSNTLAYSETLLGQAVIAAPIVWLTNNPILALNVCWFATYVLSGLAMYLLVFDLTDSRVAALIAGMGFAFNSFRSAHVMHLQLLSAQWIPMSFFFLVRLLRRQHWVDGLGLLVSFNLQILSCYYYGLFAAVALGTFLLIHTLVDRKCLSRRLLYLLLGFGALTATLQIPLSLPYFRVADALDFERSITDVIRGGADLTDFITHSPGNILFGELTAPFRGEGWWEHVAFPGALTLALAALVLTPQSLATHRRAVLMWGSIALLGWVLSLGPALKLNGEILFAPLPYRLLYEVVPGFRAIRQPARFHIITMTGLSVLAGFGASVLAGRVRRPGLLLVLVGLGLGFIGLENWAVPLQVHRVPLADDIPEVVRWLDEQAEDGPILELPILMDVGNTEALRLYYSTFHWKRMVNGYGGFYPPAYAHFLFFDREFPAQPYDWIVGLGVRYVVLHRWQYSPLELRAIDEGLEGFRDRLRLVVDFGVDQVYEVIQPATGEPNQPDQEQTLAGKVRLLGYVVKPPGNGDSTSAEVKLFWQCLERMAVDYTVFVHLLDEKGNLVSQHDGQPDDGSRPTTTCLPEEVVVDPHLLSLPADLLSGAYSVVVGMYDLETMERLPVHGSDGTIRGDYLKLGFLRWPP